ncbi:Ger(x)C family spore germination protein [Paenibacillus soyae]|uniref:Ger(X)C family spore germination protein n=1 Tax=Paenibacillus soyae TaxID=2969249 RepID=A0A9X2MUX4_9BACL|nr:Ger(x)C family spore germination protein [Paenibacillus soyae]MCR2807476.1 Ger(x)C family spore germination protein [Paenibacillus soyae]
MRRAAGIGPGKLRARLVRLMLLVLLMAACAPLSACWDIQYLDQLGVVLAVGVDDDPKGKFRYQVTVQVVLPRNASPGDQSGNGSPVMTISEKGDTLFEAIRKMSAKTSRRLFFSHMQLLAIHENTAKKDLYPLLDLIDRNADIRSDISVVIARGLRAEQLLEIRTQMEAVPANQMKEAIEVNEKAHGQVFSVLVRDIVRMADSHLKEAAVPAIGVEGMPEAGNKDNNVTQIKPDVIPELTTMAIFRDGELAGYLTPKESRGYVFLRNRIKSSVLKLSCPRTDGHYIVEIFDSDTRTKVRQSPQSSDTPLVHVQVRMEASIHELTCQDFNVHDESSFREVELAVNQAVEAELDAAIGALQKKLRSDALGWGREVYQDQPAMWKRISGNWNDVFPNVPYELECISRIQSMGIRSNSIAK